MRTLTLLAMAALLGGCVMGRPDRDEWRADPRSPYGATVDLLVSVARFTQEPVELSGELLWVEPTALVVRTEAGVSRVPLARVIRYRVHNRIDPEREPPYVWDDATARAFRSAARYPAPPDPARTRQLLDALGVDRIETVPDSAVGGAGGGGHGGPAPEAAAHHRPAGAPPPPAALAPFLEATRASAARFATLDAAIAEGYRPLGPSFPGMGEHWVQIGRIVSGRIDPERPPVLCYVRVDGEPRLASLAFTLPLGAEADPPAEPFGRDAWHDHSEAVDEESLLLAHPASHEGGDGPRLGMVHVWVWPENPDGVLAQNNWRLPFAVAGLPVDGLRPSSDAARGVSLRTAPADYYASLFRAAADPAPAEMQALREVLADHRARADAWIVGARLDGAVDDAELAAAAGIWESLWTRLASALTPTTLDRLAPLR